MWILYSILGGLCLSRFYVVTRELRNKYDYELLIMAMGVFLVPFFFVGRTYVPMPTVEVSDVAVCVVIAFVTLAAAGGVIYCNSLAVYYSAAGHLSVLAIATAVMALPVVTAAFSWPILGTPMNVHQIAAFCLTMTCIAYAIIHRDTTRSEAKGLLLVVTSIALTSTYNLIVKYVSAKTHLSGWELFLGVRTGMMVAIVIMLATPMRRRMLSLFKLPWREQMRFYVNELFFVGFALFFVLAVAAQKDKENVGLVSAVYFGTQQVVLITRELRMKGASARLVTGAAGTTLGIAYMALAGLPKGLATMLPMSVIWVVLLHGARVLIRSRNVWVWWLRASLMIVSVVVWMNIIDMILYMAGRDVSAAAELVAAIFVTIGVNSALRIGR